MRHKTLKSFLLFFFLSILLLPGSVQAQSTYGLIVGVVAR